MLSGEDLVQCLNDHRFILVPSVWEEPFGMVALEGMACGCIPIVSDGGGLPDAVGNAGLIFQRGNVDALIDAIQLVYKNKEIEERFRTIAMDYLLSFQKEPIAKRYLQVIEEVI